MTAAPAAPAIACRGLTKRYGSVLALDALDLEIPAGSVFGFLGPNGAGKTTTLRLLTSLAQPTSGEATVGGVATGGGEANRRGLIGYLDQDPRFHGWMTARDLLDLVGRLYRMPDADRRAARRRGARAGRAGRCRAPADRWLLGRDAAAARPGAGDPQPPAGAAPRRAGQLARPRGPGRHAGRDPAPGRRLDRPLLDPHPDRRRAGLRPRRDPRPRAPGDDRADGRAARALRAPGLPPRARGRAGLRRGAAWSRRCDGAAWVAGVEEAHGVLRVAVHDEADAGRALLAAVAEHGVALLAFERQRPTLEDVFLQLVGRRAHDPGAAA